MYSFYLVWHVCCVNHQSFNVQSKCGIFFPTLRNVQLDAEWNILHRKVSIITAVINYEILNRVELTENMCFLLREWVKLQMSKTFWKIKAVRKFSYICILWCTRKRRQYLIWNIKFYHIKHLCCFTIFRSSDSSSACRIMMHLSAHPLQVLRLLQTVTAVFILILPPELGFNLR